MSTVGTRPGNGCARWLVRSLRADPPAAAAQPSYGNTPYGLLWSAGTVAFVLGIVAFVLWGINGAGTLFDMMAALCN
jgi:hypothetical protein